MPQDVHSSQGGHFKVGNLVFEVAEWRIKKTAVLADATTSGGQRRKKVLSGGDFSFNTPWDLAQTPESVGLREGAEIADARFLIGDSGMMYKPPLGIILESVEVINDAVKDIARLAITGYSQGAVGDPVPAA